MAAELMTGLAIFKSLFDTAKGLKDLNDATIRNAVSIELQEKILAAQQQQAALIQRVGELEKEMASFEAWQAEKKRYHLTDFGEGTFAYLLKSEMGNGEPSHRLCATCYEQGKKSILQTQGRDSFSRENAYCHLCKVIYPLGAMKKPARRTHRVGGDGDDWMR